MLTLLENMSSEVLGRQLGYGGVLMVLGMFTVFVFLIVLIYCTKLMSVIVNPPTKRKKEREKKEAEVQKKVEEKIEEADEEAMLAIALALAYEKSLE